MPCASPHINLLSRGSGLNCRCKAVPGQQNKAAEVPRSKPISLYRYKPASSPVPPARLPPERMRLLTLPCWSSLLSLEGVWCPSVHPSVPHPLTPTPALVLTFRTVPRRLLQYLGHLYSWLSPSALCRSPPGDKGSRLTPVLMTPAVMYSNAFPLSSSALSPLHS